MASSGLCGLVPRWGDIPYHSKPSLTRRRDLTLTGESGFAVALEEARRTIDQQKDDLKSLRDRAAGLLAVAGLAASFIGGLPIGSATGQRSGWTYAGLFAFVLLALVALAMTYPYAFVFSQDAKLIVTWVEEYGASDNEVNRDLALHLMTHFWRNRRALLWVRRGYQVAVGLLMVEILMLILNLEGR